jgi:hypothetical protein
MAVPGSGTLSMLGLSKEKVHDDYSSSSGITNPISMYDLVNGGNTNGSGNSYDTTNTSSPQFPNTAVAHQMSEWYGYDHDYSAQTINEFSWSPSVDGVTTGDNGTNDIGHASKSAACSSTNTVYSCVSIGYTGTLGNGTTLYFLYSDCDLDTPLDANNRWIKIGNYGGGNGCNNDVTATYTDYVMQVSDSGIVSNFQQCVSLTSYSSSLVGVFLANCNFNGTLNTMNQTYYHDGSGTYPTAGDTCYSDSAGTSVLAAGYYTIPPSSSGVGNRTYIKISTNQGIVDTGYPQTC